MAISVGEVEATLRLKDEMTPALKDATDAVKEFGHEGGESMSFFGGIMDEVFGSWPAKIAEGVLLRDMVHELIATVKEGAIEFGIIGSEVNTAHEALERMSGGTAAATAILEEMKSGVKGTIPELDLMTQANKLLATSAIKNADEFGTLTQASRVLSREGFGPIEQVMGTVSNAMEMGRGRRLALMGVTVDTAGAEAAYAKTLGLTASDLTHSQRLFADRSAIMESLTQVVQRAGTQELNLKERIEASSAAVKNWTDDLAASIAASSHVTDAYDAIQKAIVDAFGGDAKKIADEFLGWVNSAADAAKTYGPIVVQWLKDTANRIVEIWHAVEAAWDLVPDWFKNIAKDAALAGLSLIAIDKIAKATAGSLSGMGDSISTASNLSQIFSGIPLLLHVTKLDWAFGLLSSQIGIFGVAVGVQTTASYIWSLAIGKVTVAAQSLWAVMAAHPLIAATVAVGSLVVAYTAWIERSAEAELKTQTLGAQQDSINKAIKDGAPATIKYADAVAYNNEQYRIAHGLAKPLADALKALGDSGGNSVAPLNDLKNTVKTLAEHGDLSTAAMRKIALALKEAGVATDTLDPMLQNIVKAVAIMGAQADDSTPKVSKFEQAVQSMVAALEGESKNQRENSEAINRVIKSGNDDIDVKTRLVNAIDALIGKHLKLTDAQKEFYDENMSLGTRAIATQDAVAKGWDTYYQTIQKGQGDSLAVQEAGITTWYNASYTAIEKLASKNAYEWARLAPLNAELYAKLNAASEARAQHEADVATKLSTTWGEYFSTVAKTDRELLDSQLTTINTWYTAQYAAIEKAAKANEDAWSQLEPLNALFWAKITKARTDVETAARQRIRTEETALTDFIAQQTMISTDFQVTKIWEVVKNQIAADEASGKSSAAVNELRIRLAKMQTDALYVDNSALQANSTAALQSIADKAWTTYRAAEAASGDFTPKAIANFRRVAEQAQETADGVSYSFTTAFQDIASAVPGLVQQAFTGGGGVIGALKASGSMIGSTLGKSIVGKLSDSGAIDMGSAFGKLFGAAIPMIGALAGPLISAIISLFDHVADDVSRDAGQRFGTKFSKATTDAIVKDIKAGIGPLEAELGHLSDIIKDAGGLTNSNFDTMAARLRDVFVFMQTGTMTAAQGTKILNDNWQTFVTAGTDGLGLLNTKLIEMIKLNDTAGSQSAAIASYLKTQYQGVADGFNKIAMGFTTVALANIKVASEDEAYKTLGLSSPATLKKALDDAQHAFSVISQGGQASASVLEAAAKKVEAAQAAYGNSTAIQSAIKAYNDLKAAGPASADMLTSAAGRLATAQNNLAIGKGTLDSLQKSYESLAAKGGASATDLAASLAKVHVAQDAYNKLAATGTATSDQLAIAMGKVASAQAAYDKLLSQGGASGDQLAAAQAKIAAQTDKVNALQGAVNDATAAFDKLKAQGKATDAELAEAAKKVAAAQAAVGDSLGALTPLVEKYQNDFSHMGNMATLAFAAARAGGDSTVQALTKIGPALDNLSSMQEQLGLQADGAFQHMMDIRGVLMAHKEVADSIDGMEQMMTSLANSNMMTQGTFNLMGKEAVRQFHAASDAGLSNDDTMSLMSKSLQTLWTLQKRYGFTVDESTQKMLDEAVAAGVVGDAHSTMEEQMVTAFKNIDLDLQALLKGFGIDLPNSLKTAADAATTQLGRIKTGVDNIPDQKTIRITADSSGFPDVEHMATGGVGRVTKPTLFLAGEAGPEDYAFSGGNQSFEGGPTSSGGGGSGGDDIASILRALPMLIKNAVRDGVQRTPGRR